MNNLPSVALPPPRQRVQINSPATGTTGCFWQPGISPVSHTQDRSGAYSANVTSGLCMDGYLKISDGDNINFRQDSDLIEMIEYILRESPKYFAYHSGVTYARAHFTAPGEFDRAAKQLYSRISNSENSEKKTKLNEKYLAEKQKYFHYLSNVPEEILDKLVNAMIDRLVKIEYSGVAIEITPGNSLFVELRLVDSSTLHLKLILDDLLDLKMFFAHYKDDRCLDNGIGPLNEIVNHLSELTDASRISSNTTSPAGIQK